MRSLIHKKQRHTNDAKPVVDVKDFDDWHEEPILPVAGVCRWVCPEGMYEVFVALDPVAGVMNEFLNDGLGRQILTISDTGITTMTSTMWFPCFAVVANTADAAGAIVNQMNIYHRASQGWIMTTGEIVTNNSNGFRVRYRKLR